MPFECAPRPVFQIVTGLSLAKNTSLIKTYKHSKTVQHKRAAPWAMTVRRWNQVIGPHIGGGRDSELGLANGEIFVGGNHLDLYITLWNHNLLLKSNLS